MLLKIVDQLFDLVELGFVYQMTFLHHLLCQKSDVGICLQILQSYNFLAFLIDWTKQTYLVLIKKNIEYV